MLIEITNEQSKIDVTEEMQDIIDRCIRATLLEECIKFKCECHVTLADDESIRNLNLNFRGIDKATDVLSFPMLDFEGYIREVSEENIKYDINPETGCVILGDIILSLERANEQAREYGHSIQREIGFLTVHSILHLLGYDHDEPTSREQMRQREEYVLKDMGLDR